MDITTISGSGQQLRAYADWAGKVQSDKQVVGPRTSILGQRISSRNFAVNDFRRALKETVGDTIANQAWKSGAGGSVKGLTAGIVKNVLAQANLLVTSMALKEAKGAKFSALGQLAPEEVREEVVGKLSDPKTIKQECEAITLLSKSGRFFGMTPASKKEVAEFTANINKEIRQLNTCMRNLEKSGISKLQDVAAAMRNQVSSLEGRIRDVAEFASRLPGGENSAKGLAEHWKGALADAVGVVKENLSLLARDRADGALSQFMKGFEGDGMLKALKHDKKKLCANLQDGLEKCLSKALGKADAKKMVGSLLPGLLNTCHLERLNRGAWNKIENRFEVTVGQKSVQLESDITSGSHIDDSIKAAYEDGVTAYNCHTLNTEHAVNLGTTKLQVVNQDGTKRTIFNGVRHGVHDAQDVDNAAAANVTRAKETVTAALVNYLESHAAEVARYQGSGLPIPLNMTSVSLLTPSNEGKKLDAQTAAWNSINGQEMSVTVKGQTYKVRPQVLTFNYGVNSGAVGAFSALAGGWKKSDKLNKAALNTMLVRADMFCRSCSNPKVKAAALTLMDQIQTIAKSKGERKANGDIYKMPSRIAVLSYLMGDVPVWNCKSGKDRTGWMDVECKFLATLIENGQSIPEPNAKLTTEQKDLLRTIALKAGNHEVQEYNTGAAGYKLSNKGVSSVASLYARVDAGKDAVKNLMGGSKYVGK